MKLLGLLGTILSQCDNRLTKGGGSGALVSGSPDSIPSCAELVVSAKV